jgi:hypothetical protein
MNEKLTNLQAFNAMRKFLEGYYERTNSDDVGSLLGDLQLLSGGGGTFDPAAWHDWIRSVKEVLSEK